MRKYFKRLSSFVLIPLTRWYLRKARIFNYNGITIRVSPGVFHPGLFSSTLFLLDYLSEQNLKGSRLLELGCGSGLMAIASAKAGAYVTATDKSDLAIENTRLNASSNGVDLSIIKSDLFDNIQSTFDWIVINPPYYAKDPTSEPDLAWYAGANLEYFDKLFRQMNAHAHGKSKVIMVLTKGCDIRAISAIAGKYDWQMFLIREKKVLFDEKDFLFRLEFNSYRANPA